MDYSIPVCQALKQARVFGDSEGHSVDSIDISSDGTQVVTSSEDKALRLYDSHDAGALLKTLHAKKYGVSRVRFAHAPGTVVCATRNDWDNSLRYWSLHDNRYLRYFKGHRAEVVGLCVSPKDDFLLSSSADGTCRLWDVRSGMRVKDACSGFLRLPNRDARPVIAFDDTGIVFAVGAPTPGGRGANVRLFATADHDRGPFQTIKLANEKAAAATSMKFSSNGKYLLLSGGSDVCFLIDSFKGSVVCEYRLGAGSDIITDAAITPDCNYVIAGTRGNMDSSGGSLHIWPLGVAEDYDADSQGTAIVTAEVAVHSSTHSGPVNAVLCSPMTLMVASACRNLNLWVPDLDLLSR